MFESVIEMFHALAARHVSCTSVLSAMYDLDAIEAINIDQLVTPLDRILLRNGNVRRTTRRSFDLSHQAALAVAASKKRRDDDASEKTQYMRAQRAGATGHVAGVAAALACATWLSVAVACLLA